VNNTWVIAKKELNSYFRSPDCVRADGVLSRLIAGWFFYVGRRDLRASVAWENADVGAAECPWM